MSQSSIELAADHPRLQDLTVTDRHRALADTTRRTVLETLSEHSTPVDLHELARLVTQQTTADQPDRILQDIYLSLHHIHIPLLEDVGAVEYDPESQRVW